MSCRFRLGIHAKSAHWIAIIAGTQLDIRSSHGKAVFPKEERIIRKYVALLCSSGCVNGDAVFAGAATGALATGAGCEINAKRQMDKREDDYRREGISRREYETRKGQIESRSII